MKAIGYFVVHQVGVFQQHLGTEDDGTVDPLHNGLAAGILDNQREVVGQKKQLVGIERDGALALGILLQARRY